MVMEGKQVVEAVGKEEVVDKEGLPRPARELLPMSFINYGLHFVKLTAVMMIFH